MAYDSEYILTIVGSFAFHLVLSEWLASPLLRKLSPVFVTLPADKQVVLRNSVMSIFHAVVVGGVGLYTLLYLDAMKEDLWLVSPVIIYGMCLSLGYMIADCLLMAIYVPLQDRKMVLHHAIGMFGIHNGIFRPAGLYFSNYWPLTELSSPFVHMRLILHTLGHRRSLLYKVNGLTMMVVFFLCRIASISIFFGLIPHMETGELYKLPSGILISLFLLTPMLFVLNLYWFVKICTGAYRVLFSGTPKDEQGANNKTV